MRPDGDVYNCKVDYNCGDDQGAMVLDGDI
jgi:hypothetical protein